MKRIRNPFEGKSHEEYNCFGCSPSNDIGLKLAFFDDGEGLTAFWEPKKLLQGYTDVVHGGIQSTLMDEIGAWAVYVKCETAGVTTRMEIDFTSPLRISKGKVKIEARIFSRNEKEAVMKTLLFDGDGKLCAEGLITYFIYPQAIAIRKLNYPGINAFYE